MNDRTLLLLGVLGFGGYMLYKSKAPNYAQPENNPVAGQAPAAAGSSDLFSQILGMVTSVSNTVGSFAKSSASTT